jgi:hypothetical protein
MTRLVVFGMHLLTWLFLIGLGGSLLVVIMTFLGDLAELFRRD